MVWNFREDVDWEVYIILGFVCIVDDMEIFFDFFSYFEVIVFLLDMDKWVLVICSFYIIF